RVFSSGVIRESSGVRNPFAAMFATGLLPIDMRSGGSPPMTPRMNLASEPVPGMLTGTTSYLVWLSLNASTIFLTCFSQSPCQRCQKTTSFRSGYLRGVEWPEAKTTTVITRAATQSSTDFTARPFTSRPQTTSYKLQATSPLVVHPLLLAAENDRGQDD